MGIGVPSAAPQDNTFARCPSAAKKWTPPDPDTDPMSTSTPVSYIASTAVTNINSGVVSWPFGYPYASPPFTRDSNEAPKHLGEIYGPSTSWALTDADQQNAGPKAAYYKYLPVSPSHGTIRNELFFDWHVDQAKVLSY
jgi:hypothetical protein